MENYYYLCFALCLAFDTAYPVVGYVRCVRFPQMQALASLFTCGQRVAVQDVNGRDVNGAAHGAHCTFEIALSLAAMLTLLLVCAFFLHASTKVSCVGFIMRCPFREIATLRSQ